MGARSPMPNLPTPSPRALVALALCLPLGGCGVLGVEHMLGADGPARAHAWHQWPARAGMFLITVPLTVVVAPLALLEDVTTGSSLFRKQSPGITSYVVGVPATVGAYAMGLPFFVLGLPWEFAPPPEPPPPEEADDDA